jgi:hypothetical protein
VSESTRREEEDPARDYAGPLPQGEVMSNNEAWLGISFVIMVVAVLATLYEKFEELEKRLNRLETRREPDDDGISAHAAGSIAREAFPRRDHRV